MDKVSHGDSYKLTVVRSYSRFYIYAKHYTKKHPGGWTLLYNNLLNDHLDVSDVRYLVDTLEGQVFEFEFKREDGYEFDVIDRTLNRIVKHEDYLISPKSLKCVPSVVEQLSKEFKRLIYDLISFRYAK